jgi:hypothetical protein
MNANLNPERSEVHLTESDKFKERKRNARCNRCKKLGHYARDCRMPDDRGGMKKPFHKHQKKDERRIKNCEACGKVGHSTAECTVLKAFKREHHQNKMKQNGSDSKRKRDDSSFRKFKNPRLRIHDSDNDAESDESNLLAEEANGLTEESRFAYLDSGCNRVVLNSQEAFSNLRTERKQMTTARRGATLAIDGVGSAGIYNDVYYSQNAKRNLVGVWNVTKKGYKVIFDEEEVTIVSKVTGDVALKGKAMNGLYAVDLAALLGPSGNSEILLASSQTNDMANLWHERCGHVHEQKIVEADRRGLVKGINLNNKYFRKRWNQKNKNRCVCNICAKTKLRRKSFRTTEEDWNGASPGAKITADIIVSTNTPSLEGYKYAVKYIDGATKRSRQWGLKTREGRCQISQISESGVARFGH